MITKRNFGIVVALGGLTATVALLTGLSGARAQELSTPQVNQQPTGVAYTQSGADELSTLRANQQLLQQRIDQLAQATGGAGAAAPGSLAMAQGSFPRSFLIPGTDTSLAVTGFSDLNMGYIMEGASATGIATSDYGEEGSLLSTPVGRNGTQSSRGGGEFSMTLQQSRIRIESQTPTAWGPAGSVIEFDFAGNSTGAASGNVARVGTSLVPRLRLAYGTFAGWLAGQAYSASIDLESHVDEIDFGGDVGSDGDVRQPQLRYTYQSVNGTSWALDLEQPDAGMWTPVGATDAGTSGIAINAAGETSTSGNIFATGAIPLKNPAPDVFGIFNWEQPWGHLNIRGLLRDMDFQDGKYISRNYLGYGGFISGNVLPGWFGWSKDFFGWGFEAGEGLGRYLGGSAYGMDSNYTGTNAETPAEAANILAGTVFGYGAYAGYKHWWAPQWDSDIAGGIMQSDYSSTLLGSSSDGGANKRLITSHLNLYYHPASFVDVGLEWIYGNREVVNGASGNMSVLLSEFKVKF